MLDAPATINISKNRPQPSSFFELCSTNRESRGGRRVNTVITDLKLSVDHRWAIKVNLCAWSCSAGRDFQIALRARGNRKLFEVSLEAYI